jgi:MFS family permease
VVAAWVSRIPGVQTSLGLSNAALGFSLLGAAVGSVASIFLTGTLLNRYGSRRVSQVSTYAFCLALNAPGIAWNAASLFLCLMVLGASAGMMDVAMNAQGVLVEVHLGRPTMSRFHGFYSVGAMIGALIGGAIAAHHVSVSRHFLGASLVLLACSVPCAHVLMESAAHEARASTAHPLFFVRSSRTHASAKSAKLLSWLMPRLAACARRITQMPRVLWALSAIGLCILLSEGAMGDWIAVYLRQTFAVGPATAANGFAVFSAAMAFFRLIGDHLTMRLGSVRIVRYGSLVAAGGLTVAIFAPAASWAMPGFAAVGVGFSVIVPLVFGAAGRVPNVRPGDGISTVTGLGYLGFLVGPPFLGFISQLFTLRGSLAVVLTLCLVAASLSGFLGEAQSAPGSWNEPSPIV